MPEMGAQGLDVSQEELRFLRRVFRRFALPYLVLALIAVGVGFAAATRMVATGGGAPTEVEGLIAEAAGLREAIAGLRQDLAAMEARIGSESERVDGRFGALERKVAEQQKLAAQRREASSSEVSSEVLKQRLDHAHQRINALEGRLSAASRTASDRSEPANRPPAGSTPAAPWPGGPDRP